MSEPMFGAAVGPWFRWFAWRPTHTTDRGWRWMRPVWRRRYQTKPHLDGPVMLWFLASASDPRPREVIDTPANT